MVTALILANREFSATTVTKVIIIVIYAITVIRFDHSVSAYISFTIFAEYSGRISVGYTSSLDNVLVLNVIVSASYHYIKSGRVTAIAYGNRFCAVSCCRNSVNCISVNRIIVVIYDFKSRSVKLSVCRINCLIRLCIYRNRSEIFRLCRS